MRCSRALPNIAAGANGRKFLCQVSAIGQKQAATNNPIRLEFVTSSGLNNPKNVPGLSTMSLAEMELRDPLSGSASSALCRIGKPSFSDNPQTNNSTTEKTIVEC